MNPPSRRLSVLPPYRNGTSRQGCIQ